MTVWPFKRPPYPAQAAALAKLGDFSEAGYWMEQGLGKTDVDLAHFIGSLEADKVDAQIVLCPNYLKSGWEENAINAGLNMDEVPMYFWPNVQKSNMDKIRRKPHIIVMNMEAILQTGGRWLEEQLPRARYKITIDESSSIKKHNGITTSRAMQLARQCPIRTTLSGTPMPLNVGDIWSQMRFMRKLEGVNYYSFRNRYAVMGGYMGKVIKGVRNEEQLHRLMDEAIFRALKKDWWDGCPDKIYPPPLEFEMTPAQKSAYRTMALEFYYDDGSMKDGGEGIFANMAITAMIKLQQITRGFIKDGDRIIELVTPVNNPAIKTTLRYLDTVPGKAIIFAHHTYSVNALSEALRDRGVVTLRGGMSQEQIKEAKAQFNGNPVVRYLVGQSSVTQKGHTLLGGPDNDRCSTSLFYENTYNKETRDQSEDRNHRYGQDKNVVYQDLFGSKEDRKMIDAFQHKQNVIDAVLNAIRALRSSKGA